MGINSGYFKGRKIQTGEKEQENEAIEWLSGGTPNNQRELKPERLTTS